MNNDLEFRIAKDHIKDLMREAEQHRLWSKVKKARKEQKSQAAENKKADRLGKSKTWREAFGGTS